eukprot:IDg18330t1
MIELALLANGLQRTASCKHVLHSTISEIQKQCRALRKAMGKSLELKHCKEIIAACSNALLPSYSLQPLNADLLWLSLGLDLEYLSNAIPCTRLCTIHRGDI